MLGIFFVLFVPYVPYVPFVAFFVAYFFLMAVTFMSPFAASIVKSI